MNMMMRLATALAVLTLGTASGLAQDVLQPTSAWTLDYGDEKCSLLRDFGSLDEGIGLRVDSYGLDDTYRVYAIGDRVPRQRWPVSPVDVILLEEEGERANIGALNGLMGGYRYLNFPLSFLPKESSKPTTAERKLSVKLLEEDALPKGIDTDFEARVNSMTIELRPGEKVTLNTGPIAQAMKAMRACVDDLRASWGLDPAEQRQIARRAYAPFDAVKKIRESYPPGLAFRGENGFIPLRVMVSKDGSASGCVIQVPQAPEPFREAACSALGTAFVPAIDADGNPVDSFYHVSVIYLASPF